MRRLPCASLVTLGLALALAIPPAAARANTFGKIASATGDILFARPVLFLQGTVGALQYVLPVAPVIATVAPNELGPAFREMVTKPMVATFTEPPGTFRPMGPIVRQYGEADAGRLKNPTSSNVGWLFSLTNPFLFLFPAIETAITAPRDIDDRWNQFGVEPSRYVAGLR